MAHSPGNAAPWAGMDQYARTYKFELTLDGVITTPLEIGHVKIVSGGMGMEVGQINATQAGGFPWGVAFVAKLPGKLTAKDVTLEIISTALNKQQMTKFAEWLQWPTKATGTLTSESMEGSLLTFSMCGVFPKSFSINDFDIESEDYGTGTIELSIDFVFVDPAPPGI